MKAHEGTLRHMEREALNRGEGEVELTENPGDVQYYVKKVYGKSHRYYKVDVDPTVPEVEILDLTEWNKRKEEFHKTGGNTHCSSGVLCPTCKSNGGGEIFMTYASESVLSNAGNRPGRREVFCHACKRTGNMLL